MVVSWDPNREVSLTLPRDCARTVQDKDKTTSNSKVELSAVYQIPNWAVDFFNDISI